MGNGLMVGQQPLKLLSMGSNPIFPTNARKEHHNVSGTND